jgi:Mn2+/Fe2+ NRAMP family transporter
VLLALGLIGSGLLAVPILTSSAAFGVAEAFGWPRGLDAKPRRARAFYGVFIGATLVGMLINFIGINPIAALFWTAVINGFLAPPLLVVILLIANNRAIMGERTNHRLSNTLGWITAGKS